MPSELIASFRVVWLRMLKRYPMLSFVVLWQAKLPLAYFLNFFPINLVTHCKHRRHLLTTLTLDPKVCEKTLIVLLLTVLGSRE